LTIENVGGAGATTLSTTSFSIMTLSITIKMGNSAELALSIMALRITIQNVTFIRNGTQYNNKKCGTQHKSNTAFGVMLGIAFFIVTLSVVMLNVVVPTVAALSG
jgi:hypothetical protein